MLRISSDGTTSSNTPVVRVADVHIFDEPQNVSMSFARISASSAMPLSLCPSAHNGVELDWAEPCVYGRLESRSSTESSDSLSIGHCPRTRKASMLSRLTVTRFSPAARKDPRGGPTAGTH